MYNRNYLCIKSADMATICILFDLRLKVFQIMHKNYLGCIIYNLIKIFSNRALTNISKATAILESIADVSNSDFS